MFFSLLQLLWLNTVAASTLEMRLGSVQVGDRTDREVIVLPKCNGRENIKVNSIQIQVQKKPVQVDKLKVVFHNGAEQELSVKKNFKVGEQSRWLDLNGEARCIKKIIFVGDTNTRKMKTKKHGTVIVSGKVKTKKVLDNDSPPSIEATPHRMGVIKLGDATEKDSIKLPSCNTENNSKVSQLKIKVKDNPVEINRVKVQFYNGSTQTVTVNKHLKVGDSSPWVDLNGDKRCVEKITFIGDADTMGYRPGKEAKLIVFGQ